MSSGNNKGVTCKVCGSELSGKQTLYCGSKCKMRFHRATKRKAKAKTFKASVTDEVKRQVAAQVKEITEQYDEGSIILTSRQRVAVHEFLVKCSLVYKPDGMSRERWFQIKRGPFAVLRSDARLINSSLHGFMEIIDRP